MGSHRTKGPDLDSQVPLEKSPVQPWNRRCLNLWLQNLELNLWFVNSMSFRTLQFTSLLFKVTLISGKLVQVMSYPVAPDRSTQNQPQKSSFKNHTKYIIHPKYHPPKVTLISGKLVMSNPVAPEHFIFLTHWSSSLAVSMAGRWLNFSHRWPPTSPG